MATVQGTKIDFVRQQMSQNPSLTYDQLLNAWTKAGYDKREAPHSTLIYKVRQERKKKTATVVESRTQASVSPPQPLDEPAIQPTIENNANEEARPSIEESYEEIEKQLDDLLYEAQQIQDSELCDAIRRARRLASKQLV